MRLEKNASYKFSFVLELAVFSNQSKLLAYFQDIGFRSVSIRFDTAPPGFLDLPSPSFPDRKLFVQGTWGDETTDVADVLSVDGYETLRLAWYDKAPEPADHPDQLQNDGTQQVSSGQTLSPWEGLKKLLFPAFAFILGLFGAKKILDSGKRG
jgi:hypothetical protein